MKFQVPDMSLENLWIPGVIMNQTFSNNPTQDPLWMNFQNTTAHNWDF